MKKKEILELFRRGDYMSLSLKDRGAVVRGGIEEIQKSEEERKRKDIG